MDPIPPPPVADEPPPPPAASHSPGSAIPPASEREWRSADVLRRRRRFSWWRFGGDGFLISLAFHLLLGIAGFYWVIARYVEAPPPRPETEVFVTGVGGPKGDPTAKRPSPMKMPVPHMSLPSPLVAKSPTATLTLPTPPSLEEGSFASLLSSGAFSPGAVSGFKGMGGHDAGFGTGGNHFVSQFGVLARGAPGLPGVFYDCKLTRSALPSKYASDSANNEYVDRILRPFLHNWDVARLDSAFFRAPESLTASRLFIPVQDSSAAPKAYGVADRCKPNRWICHYSGVVIAPKTGRFRFWVYADDVCLVRWNRMIVADNGWTTLGLPGSGNYGVHKSPFRGVDGNLRRQGRSDQIIFRPGPWFDVVRGREYPMEILLGDVGGLFGTYVLMEEADASAPNGDGKIFLFRMSSEDSPEELTDDTGLSVDMTGKGLIWRSRPSAPGPVR